MWMLLLYVVSMLIQLPYYVCRNYMYTHAYTNIYIQCAVLYRMWFL